MIIEVTVSAHNHAKTKNHHETFTEEVDDKLNYDGYTAAVERIKKKAAKSVGGAADYVTGLSER